ncbi:MAG: DUF6776 family protein [Pseudomonadota bacterium]
MELKPTRWNKRQIILALAALLMLVLALEAGVYMGQHFAYRSMGANPDNYQSMQAELIAVQNTLRERTTDLEVLATRREIDLQALEMVRKELAAQEEEIAALEEGLALYRGLMAPGDLDPGLNLYDMELMAGDRNDQYLFRFILQQEARRHALLKGNLTAVVSGVANGQFVELPLAELSEDIPHNGVDLQFRYFQSVEGQLVLPEGFEPSEVTVEANTRKPNAFTIRESFPWQLEERLTHVGK